MSAEGVARFADLTLEDRLLIVRRGTDFFDKQLRDRGDVELAGPTLLAGWTRSHLVAHLGYNAIALCRLLDWARTGVETPMYASAEARAAEIDEGATASPSELRNLFADTAAHLDEQWHQLPAAAWQAEIRTAQGAAVPATETVWMRTREVWIHAVDLNTDAGFDDFPQPVLEGLLADIVAKWHREGAEARQPVVLEIDGRAPITVGGGGGPVAGGPLAAVVRWLAGRGGAGLTVDRGLSQPRWL